MLLNINNCSIIIYFILFNNINTNSSNIILFNSINSFKNKHKNRIYNSSTRNLYYKFKNTVLTFNHMKRLLNENLMKCNISDEFSLRNSLCIECNSEKGYYPLYYNTKKDVYLKNYIKYKACYNNDTIPSNYYFNTELNVYEECYESCSACYGHGESNDHNCSSCKDNYIFEPEVKYTKNCLKKCNYYFYYSLIGKYFCTENYYCPKEINLVIEVKNQCVYDCKIDNIYSYQYNGECLNKCPDNTKPNSLNQCIDTNIEKCTLTIKNSRMKGSSLNSSIINQMAINFAKEFLYTNNHISQFNMENYMILFYKNKSCISEFNLNNSIIDCDECLKKIYYYYNISFPLTVIVDKIGKYNNPSTKYAFFNPITGEKLNTSFCQNTFIEIKKNISSIYKKEEYDWLTSQNIDIYNLTSPFYINVCFHFKSNKNKDIILPDRILLYYPNVTLCEEGCEYKGTNFTSLIATCDCKYNDLHYDLINANLLEDDLLKVLTDKVISDMVELVDTFINIKNHVWTCYKNIFIYKYFITNIGGLIIFVMLIIQIICIIVLSYKGFLDKISKFIILVTNLYINHKKRKDIFKMSTHYNKQMNTDLKSIKDFEKKKSKKKINTVPTEKNEKINEKAKRRNKVKNDIKEKINISSSFETSKKTLDIIKKNEDNKISNDDINEKRRNSIIDLNNINYLDKYNKSGTFTEKDMKQFLLRSRDEMDFYDALNKDKRSFCVFLVNKIVKKQLIIYTFFVKEETVPIYIKIIFLTLYIDLYLLGNAIIYTPQDVRMLYHLNRKEYMIFFIKRFITKIFICFTITTIIHFVLDLFLAEKKSIQTILKREKNNEVSLRNEIYKLIKSIKIRYIIFLVLNLIINLSSFFMIFTFNDAYPYTQRDWVRLSFSILIISQVINVILALLETSLRFLALKYNVEGIFDLSKYLNRFY